MKTNEILDLATRAYQGVGWPILQAVVAPTLCCMAGFVFFWSYVFPAIWTTKESSGAVGDLSGAITAVALGIFVAAPLLLIGSAYTTALSTHIVSDYMLGNVPHVEAAKRGARRRLTSVLGVFLRQMAVSIGFLVLSVGLLMLSAVLSDGTSDSGYQVLFATVGLLGIVLGFVWLPIGLCRDALASAAMVIEGVNGKEAARRSRELLKGARGVPSGYDTLGHGFILVGLLYLLAAWGLMSLVSQLGVGEFLANHAVGSAWSDLLDAMFGYFPWFLVIWVTVPLWSMICTILYFERRVRKEGYDIEVLAKDVWQADKSHRFEL